jgi:hypothetical protein
MVAPSNDLPGGLEIGPRAWRATTRGSLAPLSAGERLAPARAERFTHDDWIEPRPDDAPPASFDEALVRWAADLAQTATDDSRATWTRADLDGDGIKDILFAIGSADPMRPRTVLRAYLGSGDPARLPDQRAPDSVLRTRSPLSGGSPVARDLDGDGDLDTWLFEIDAELASPSDQLKAYLQVGVRGLLRVYTWDGRGGGYSAGRSFALPMTIKYEVHGNRLPYLREIGPRIDFNGDGTLDVALRTGARSLELWGFEAGRGFGDAPLATIETAAPITSILTADLDGDGLGDLQLTLEDGSHQLVLPRRR